MSLNSLKRRKSLTRPINFCELHKYSTLCSRRTNSISNITGVRWKLEQQYFKAVQIVHPFRYIHIAIDDRAVKHRSIPTTRESWAEAVFKKIWISRLSCCHSPLETTKSRGRWPLSRPMVRIATSYATWPTVAILPTGWISSSTFGSMEYKTKINNSIECAFSWHYHYPQENNPVFWSACHPSPRFLHRRTRRPHPQTLCTPANRKRR